MWLKSSISHMCHHVSYSKKEMCTMQANGSWQKEGAVSSISSDFLNTLRFLVLSFLKIRFLRKDLQSERDYFSTALGDIQGGKNPKHQSSFNFLLRHNQTLGMSLKISAWHDIHGLLEKVRMSSSGFVSCFLCDSCNVDTVSLAHALHPKITSPPIWEFQLCLHSWHSQL